jgi:hypothetical protein
MSDKMYPTKRRVNHQFAGCRQWPSKRLNLSISSKTIRNGIKPQTLQKRTNGCKRSIPMLAKE